MIAAAAAEEASKDPNKDLEANEKTLLLNGSDANEDDTKKHIVSFFTFTYCLIQFSPKAKREVFGKNLCRE